MDGFIDVPAAWPFATRPQLLARPRAPRSFDAGGEVVDAALLVDASQDEALAAHVAQAQRAFDAAPTEVEGAVAIALLVSEAMGGKLPYEAYAPYNPVTL